MFLPTAYQSSSAMKADSIGTEAVAYLVCADSNAVSELLFPQISSSTAFHQSKPSIQRTADPHDRRSTQAIPSTQTFIHTRIEAVHPRNRPSTQGSIHTEVHPHLRQLSEPSSHLTYSSQLCHHQKVCQTNFIQTGIRHYSIFLLSTAFFTRRLSHFGFKERFRQ